MRKYHTVGTILKSNWKVVETEANLILLYVYMIAYFFWPNAGILAKSGGFKGKGQSVEQLL